MYRQNAKYGRGDLVLFNDSGNFGNEDDRLFHIHSVRYGTCTDVETKQYWYSGYLFKIGDFQSKGLPTLPVFSTTLTNASENQLRRLENLSLE